MKKKGFLNIKLLAIVLLIIVIIIAVVMFLDNNVKDQELQSLSTVMLQIQAKAKVINEKNKLNNTIDCVGTDISEDELKKLNLQDNGKIKVLSEDDLKSLDVKDNSAEKNFAINYETEEVYCLDGYETRDKQIIYSLTDINNLAVK